MVKGLLVGLGIILGVGLVCIPLIPIPVVHFSILFVLPLSPFFAGYIGMSFVQIQQRHYAINGLIYGCLLGLLVGLAGVVVAFLAISLWGEDDQRVRVLAWIGAVVYTLYTGSMSTMGAMYYSLRKQQRAKRETVEESQAKPEPDQGS